MDLVARLPNVPLAALSLVAHEIQKFGAEVTFETPSSGFVECPAGKVQFLHDGELLSVFLVTDLGWFSRKLLVGGIRQTVEEAVEKFLKTRAAAAGK